MDTKVAVSYSTVHDSFKAGSEMSHKALSEAGLKKCQFAFVFASCEHDSNELLKGVISILGNKTLIVGGTSSGVITCDYMGYEGFHAGIMVLGSDDIFFNISSAERLVDGEYEAGRRLGKYISSLGPLNNPNLLLLYDGMRSNRDNKMPLYETVPLLAGIQSEIGSWPPVAGVGFSVGLDMRKTEVWVNRTIFEDSAISLVVSGNVRMDTTIMHGLRPSSDYHKITRVSNNLLLEFDGRPAIEVAEEYLGKPDDIDWVNASYMITMGVNKGEKYGPFVEENYLNRMILGVDQSTGALIAIEGDLKVGDEFQFMRRSIETDMVAYMAQKLLDSLGKRKPLFAFYISCLGRVKKFLGTEKEESDEIRNVIGTKMPLIGIYSGVEIARIRDDVLPLDWTGVLCVFSKPLE